MVKRRNAAATLPPFYKIDALLDLPNGVSWCVNSDHVLFIFIMLSSLFHPFIHRIHPSHPSSGSSYSNPKLFMEEWAKMEAEKELKKAEERKAKKAKRKAKKPKVEALDRQKVCSGVNLTTSLCDWGEFDRRRYGG